MTTISGLNQRELGRKERSKAEVERQIHRYDKECGELVVRHVSKETIEKLNNGEITLNEI